MAKINYFQAPNYRRRLEYKFGQWWTSWDYSVDTKDVNLEILHFKQFYKHFVFDKDEEGYVKKTQKNYMDVRVVLRLVWGNTKNIINPFCTFYKSSLKGCSFLLKGVMIRYILFKI